MGEGGCDQHAVILQHAADLPQRFFRLRNDMQRVGHDHHVKGLSGIGQAEHVLHGEMQLGGVIPPLRLLDHLWRGVRGLHHIRRIDDMPGDQPRAGGQLQHRLMPHHRTDQFIQPLIRRRVLLHKPVIPPGVSIPEILIRAHIRTASPRISIN